MKNKIKNYTISSLYKNDKRVPTVKLTGKWLEDNGFKIGDKIKVSSSKDILLIVRES